ncbi:MAG: hypothetical protein J6S67_15090 [Methanobrevibacter sp.]|nr:hypothetical protein [Methanobrevibacter sp.]
MREIIVATIDGNTTTFNSFEEFNKATFSPSAKYEFVVLGRLQGKTYAEKKEEVRQKALDVQYYDEGGLTYGELSFICDYFETYGKRYGLLREFKENGIC